MFPLPKLHVVEPTSGTAITTKTSYLMYIRIDLEQCSQTQRAQAQDLGELKWRDLKFAVLRHSLLGLA